VLRHRLAFGSIATAHLAAAGGSAYAGAPIATPAILAAAGVVAVVLGVTGPPDAADRRRRRTERHRLGRLETTGRLLDDEPPA
jgi:hypothetical protein